MGEYTMDWHKSGAGKCKDSLPLAAVRLSHTRCYTIFLLWGACRLSDHPLLG